MSKETIIACIQKLQSERGWSRTSSYDYLNSFNKSALGTALAQFILHNDAFILNRPQVN